MTREEAVARCVAETPFSEADINGLLDCSPDEMALIVEAVHDRAKRPPRSAWDTVLTILSACVDVANVVVPLTGAISGIQGIAGK